MHNVQRVLSISSETLTHTHTHSQQLLPKTIFTLLKADFSPLSTQSLVRSFVYSISRLFHTFPASKFSYKYVFVIDCVTVLIVIFHLESIPFQIRIHIYIYLCFACGLTSCDAASFSICGFQIRDWLSVKWSSIDEKIRYN